MTISQNSYPASSSTPESEEKCTFWRIGRDGNLYPDWDAHYEFEADTSPAPKTPPGLQWRPRIQYNHATRCIDVNHEKCRGSIPVSTLRRIEDFDQLVQKLVAVETDRLVALDEIGEAFFHHFRTDVDLKQVIEYLKKPGYEFNWPEPTEDGLSTRTPEQLLGMEFDDSDRIAGDHVIAKGQSTVLLGAPGTHKSGLALIGAVSTIVGRPFLAFETYAPDSIWLFIQTENSNKRLNRDLAKLRAWVGDDALWEKVMSQIVFHTVEKDVDALLHLDDEENLKQVSDLITKHDPDVIVFDPLRDFACGDLNFDSDMAKTCAAISRVSRKGNPDRAIVVLHHALTGRAGASRATGYDRSSFGRNSKVLLGWARSVINIAPGVDSSNDVLVVACGKNSNAREFSPFAVQFNNDSLTCKILEDFSVEAWKDDVSNTNKQTSSKPERTLTAEHVLAHLPPGQTVHRDVLIQKTKDSQRVGEKKVSAFIRELIDSKVLHEWHLKRHRKRDEIRLSRDPQPEPADEREAA